MILSSNGWQASQDPEEIGIKSYTVPGTKIKLRCSEGAAPLLVTFAAEFHAHFKPYFLHKACINTICIGLKVPACPKGWRVAFISMADPEL